MVPELVLAKREILREWARSFISSISIALGVALLIAADLLSTAVTSEIENTPEARAITGFMSEQLNVGLTAVSLVIAVGAGFIVFNTLSMAVTQRLADLGRLRAVGMTTAQTTRSILFEASLLGLLGVGIGIPAGIGLTFGVIRLLENTSPMFNQFGNPEVSCSRLLLAAGLGLAVALVAAISPARRACRVSPLAMLRRSTSEGDGKRRGWVVVVSTVLMVGILSALLLFPPAFWIEPLWDNRLLVFVLILWLGCFITALPGWIEVFTRGIQGITERFLGPAGLLGIRNSQRARQRVSYTALTLALGVAMIMGATGYITYWFDELFMRTMEATLRDDGSMGIFPIDVAGGMQAYSNVAQFNMPRGLIVELEGVVRGRATFAQVYFVLIPELSFMGEDYFSFILDPQDLWATRDLYFQFSQGNWEDALPLLEKGCGVLMTPLVAARNEAGLYDRVWLDTLRGPVECVVAGIGSPMVGASIVSDAVIEDYGLTTPVSLVVLPYPETDRETLFVDIEKIMSGYKGVWLTELSKVQEMQWEAMESVKLMMKGMLVLAILGASLGVVTVLKMGIQERSRELAVLRAAGATQKQVRGMVLVEAGVIGLAGGSSGLIFGAGLVMIYTLTVGGGFMGFMDLPVREAAFTTLGSALGNGMLALILSPMITLLAAWILSKRVSLSGSGISLWANGALD
jgi:putative ABC transport system permease protein